MTVPTPGLVGVVIAHSSAVIYIQPESTDSERWMVTFEARDTAVDLDAASVLRLASELHDDLRAVRISASQVRCIRRSGQSLSLTT